jgi:hypothetical protein
MRLPKELNDVAVGQYLEALEIRKICHEMVALLGGKIYPHRLPAGRPLRGPAQNRCGSQKPGFLGCFPPG